MRQRPGEMDPRRIDAVPYLVKEDLFPSRSFRRRQSVPALPVGADEEDFRLRYLRQDAWQGAHEHMVAAQRLQTPVDESDDRFRAVERSPSDRRAGVGGR